ncbi:MULTISPECIES: hypothetical protein [unclassified Brevundimonas]|jgi:hypothetical protein|nr:MULTISPECIES: hypothetical protein [unclassified Brevundimonas]QFU30521.1 hypothetical protein BSP_02475 [Brevundimonas sp. Bb-A]
MQVSAKTSIALKGLLVLGGLVALVAAVGILGAPVFMAMALNG